MAEFSCPFAVKRRQYKFLMCERLMQSGKDYNNVMTAMEAFCAHQRYCKCKKGVINTEEARSCYNGQLAKD